MIAVVTGVGSEVAHRVTPALATVRLSNRACRFPAHGFHEDSLVRGDKPILAIEHPCRHPLPADIAPALVAVRPNTTDNPAIQSVEEPSDVGSFVILAPAPQQRIKFLNQFLGLQRDLPLGSLPDLIHETTDGLLLRVRIKRTLPDLATNLALGKLKFPFPALDFVSEELEAIPNMDNPRLLRMQRKRPGVSGFGGPRPLRLVPPLPIYR